MTKTTHHRITPTEHPDGIGASDGAPVSPPPAGTSLIERAMASLSHGAGHGLMSARFAPPPVPEALRAPVSPPVAPPPASPGASVPPVLTPPPVSPPAPPPVAIPAPMVEDPVPVIAKPAPVSKPTSKPAPARASSVPPAPPTQLHKVSRHRLAEAGMVLPEGGATQQLEEFRIVKRQLLEQVAALEAANPHDATARRLMITSPHRGDGKTFCAVNLALAIAVERDSEVLLVDCDLAHAKVLHMLGLPSKGPGLMDALVDPTRDVHAAILATDIPRLLVLPGGTSTDSDAEYLTAAGAEAVLDRLTEGADNRIVLFDTPPVLAASLPVALARRMGQVVLVARADTTPQGAIEDAASLLGGGPAIQLLLNATRFSPSGRRFGAHDRKG